MGFLAFAIPYVGWIVGLAFWGAAITRLTRRRPMKAPPIRGQVHAPVAPQPAWPVRTDPSPHPAPRSRPPERRTASHEVGHHAPGQPIRLSGRGRQAVVGEQYHPEGIRAAIAGRTVPPPGDWDKALPVSAVLIREPKNPHDRNAVRVDVRTAHGFATVGYIPAEDAIFYAPGLDELTARGRYGEVDGRIVAGHAHAQVYLHLAGPPAAAFANELGSSYLRWV